MLWPGRMVPARVQGAEFDTASRLCETQNCCLLSANRLSGFPCRSGGIGRRAWFRSMYSQGCGGSSPFFGTIILRRNWRRDILVDPGPSLSGINHRLTGRALTRRFQTATLPPASSLCPWSSEEELPAPEPGRQFMDRQQFPGQVRSSSRRSAAPARKTTAAATRCLHSSSSAPNTAHSAMAGC